MNNTFDLTMSNKVSLQISNTPYSSGVSGNVNLGVLLTCNSNKSLYDKIIIHLFSCYTCNSNKSLYDQIIIYLFFLVTMIFHFILKVFETFSNISYFFIIK